MLRCIIGWRDKKENDMFGFSVFMNEQIDEQKRCYIGEMAKSGFTGIFTSMHIPEDDASAYKERLAAIGEEAKRHNLDLMVDISGVALQTAGFAADDLSALVELGVTGLRMDFHISNEQMALWSRQIKISLNASTLTEKDIAELEAAGAVFANLEAWHNYYPRPETGLDRQWFAEKNKWLKEKGLTVQAFVSGDSDLRGPLFEGLPTLEEHRGINPLAAAMEIAKLDVDLIYIGDGGLSKKVQQQFLAYQQEKVVTIFVEDSGSEYFEYILGEHINRQDDARDVIRSAQARFKKIPQIKAEKTAERKRGAVTVDNEEYLRYMGEIQIVKHDLPADSKVNVVAQVTAQDISLIAQIGAGIQYKLVKREEVE